MEWKGYKEEIIRMLEQITSDRRLSNIYHFVLVYHEHDLQEQEDKKNGTSKADR